MKYLLLFVLHVVPFCLASIRTDFYANERYEYGKYKASEVNLKLGPLKLSLSFKLRLSCAELLVRPQFGKLIQDFVNHQTIKS